MLLSGFTALVFCIGIFAHMDYMGLIPWVSGVTVMGLEAWALYAQGVSLILTIILTEMALRKEFDKNGERRR